MVRQLLGDLAAAEDVHERTAGDIKAKHFSDAVRNKESEDASRRFILQIVQPSLVGLMDGLGVNVGASLRCRLRHA